MSTLKLDTPEQVLLALHGGLHRALRTLDRRAGAEPPTPCWSGQGLCPGARHELARLAVTVGSMDTSRLSVERLKMIVPPGRLLVIATALKVSAQEAGEPVEEGGWALLRDVISRLAPETLQVTADTVLPPQAQGPARRP